MWLKNTWYVAAFESELDEPFIARRLLDVPVILYGTSTGEVAALDDLCPHRLVRLSLGKRVADEMQCGYHGMRFSADGKCVQAPGQTNIPAAACVKSYPAVLKHGFVWVWLGNAQLADEALIPDLHWNDSEHWTASRGYHHFNADFRLLNDNLLDLSHETYVHARTIGNDEEQTIADYPLKVSVEEGCLVRAHREMPNIAPPPFFSMMLKHDGPINRWQTAINLTPGINMTDVGFHPVETPRSEAFVNHILHLLTPETAGSTHYFWSIVRNYRRDEEPLTEIIGQQVSRTFDEDKEVLEHQQQQIQTLNLEVPSAALRVDEAAIRARRILAEQVKREKEFPDTVVRPAKLVDEAELPLPN